MTQSFSKSIGLVIILTLSNTTLSVAKPQNLKADSVKINKKCHHYKGGMRLTSQDKIDACSWLNGFSKSELKQCLEKLKTKMHSACDAEHHSDSISKKQCYTEAKNHIRHLGQANSR